jgi:hypothetical protein
MRTPNGPELDALADAIAQRLGARLPADISDRNIPNIPTAGITNPGIPIPGGPIGKPDLERPNLPWDPHFNAGADVLPRARLVIAGMELTQSIQYNGAAGPTYGSDNAVPLIALKTLVARVYPCVSSHFALSDNLTGRRVTGELIVSYGDRVAYRTGPTRASGARIGPQRSLDRTLWDEDFTGLVPSSTLFALQQYYLNSSLNFIVPAYYCRGSRTTFSVRIWRSEDGPSSAYHATASQMVTFFAVPAPRVCLVRVNWTDASGNVTKPTDISMLDTTRVAERMLPFPYFETTILGVEENKSGAFAAVPASAGGCNPAWLDLITDLNVTRIFTLIFGLGDIVFGMVPAVVIPAGAKSINAGCGIVAGGCIIGQNQSFAHELGHIYRRPHVAVPGDASSDPNYPNYGGDIRSIGEVGIDTGTSPPTLYDPADTGDIMSYPTKLQPKLWISPYTYQRILDEWDLHPSAPADPRHVRSLLILSIRLHRISREFGRVELRQAHRVEAAGLVPPRIGATFSPLSVDMLDRDGRILATHHCFYVPAHGGGCCGGDGHVSPEREPYLDMQEAIEWPGEDVVALSFHRGEEPIARLEVGEAPSVEIQGPERREGSLFLRVQTRSRRAGSTGTGNTTAENTPSPTSVVVLFTGDDGETWQPVAFNPPNGEVLVDAERLPGGERCRFRAIATGRLRAAQADTEPFELTLSRRKLYVSTPDDSCGIAPGAVALHAFVDTRGRGAVAPQEIRWHSSLEGDLGIGLDLIAQLGEGRHEITATAPDGIGGTLTERAIIIVGGHPQR